MVTFTVENVRFSLRVAGVLQRRGGTEVLLQSTDEVDYWVLPGGRVHLGEASEQALRREMREELGIEIETPRLLLVAEHFFPDRGHLYHELGFYYRFELPESATVMQTEGMFLGLEPELESRLVFQWFPLGSLGQHLVYPLWLPDVLRSMPDSIQHMVGFDETS
jgi:8-oxo-dGTP pyrophosphatase MutT (NUDIX family)